MIDPTLPNRPDSGPTDRLLRQFGGLCFVLFAALAWWEGYVHEHGALGLVFAALAVVLGSLALARPRALGPLYNLLVTITFPIGLIVSTVVLGVLFFVVFAPIGLVFRLFGRDALGRRAKLAGPGSYWKPYPATTNPRRYFRQF